MRRLLVVLALALGLTVAAFGAGAIWLFSTDCGLLCGAEVTTDPDDVAAMTEVGLGIAFPAGIVPQAAREGGFQDRFLQVRLTATDAGFDALLARLGRDRSALDTAAVPSLGPEGSDWWPTGPGQMLTTTLPAPELSHLTLYAQPDPDTPGRWIILLWGFGI